MSTHLDEVSWRERLLERSGFPTPVARSLARDRDADLLELLGLVDDGCDPLTAVRLSSPADVETRPC